MVAPELGTFALGKTVYPLKSSTTNSLLLDADAPLYWLLDYFKSSLMFYGNARYQAEIAKFNIAHMPNIVGQVSPTNPFPYLQDSSIKFPLLAIYRVDGKLLEHTISFDRIQSNLEIAYVFSPLSLAQMEVGSPILNMVLDILSDRSGTGFDPNYAPPALISDGYDWGSAAGFDWLQVTDYTRMMIPHLTTNLPMEAIVLKMAMRERNNPVVNAYETLTGVDTEMDLVNNPNDSPPSIIKNFVDINSNYDPPNF